MNSIYVLIKWLRTQLERRKLADADAAELADNEKNPDWIIDKAK